MPELPPAVLVDCDGTISSALWREYLINHEDAVHRRWNDFHEALTADAPISTVVNFVRYLHDEGVTVILCTSRNEQHRYITEWWFAENKIDYHLLLMRPDNDFRKSEAVKRSLYEEHVEGKYDVRLALDDHEGVCDMWLSLGIPVVRVEDPGHEPLYREETSDV